MFTFLFGIGFRYEDQLRQRGDLENDFIVSKKVLWALKFYSSLCRHWRHMYVYLMCVLQEVDEGHLEAVALAVDLEDLMRTMAFLRLAFDEVMKVMKIQLVN